MRMFPVLRQLALFVLVSLIPVYAQVTGGANNSVPSLISYTAALKAADGKLVTSITGVTFLIYKEEQGGAPLWIETQNVNPDRGGHYTVQLGAAAAHGIPSEIFQSGEARWLAVQIAGEAEQPRVLLVAVPYAMKAADAQTLNGLPASAFVLAAPPSVGGGAASGNSDALTPGSPAQPAVSNVTTNGGTVNALPLFTSSTNIQNSIVTQTGTYAVIVAGQLNLPATGTATATAGKSSQPADLVASVFNKTTGTAVAQTFQLQTEPANNNTSNASGTLNLLYASGTNKPAETGFKISNKGVLTFATGQTFPGTGPGTVTSVGLAAPSSDFTVSGSPITSSGTLNLAWSVAPTSSNVANAIVKRNAAGATAVTELDATNVIAKTTGTGAYGVIGLSGTPSVGVAGGTGVYGGSSDPAGNGVWGDDEGHTGVYGTGVIGVWGRSGSSYGVYGVSAGTAAGSDGVHGETSSGASAGVYGSNSASGGAGVVGSGTGYGVYGTSPNDGVYGTSPNNGVYGFGNAFGTVGVSNTGSGSGVGAFNSSTGDALFASNQSGGLAGYMLGDFQVNGTLSKGGGSFKIDHPLDPANKYLYHSFVESPDMMNIYNGNVSTDDSGEAVVTMPDWFESLNRDFRYQLTVIGQFAQAIVSQELANGQFTIKTDKPRVKVSWQITGIRQDAWANAHRIPVEVEKPASEQGLYLYPELFGASTDKSIGWSRHPEARKLLMQQRALPSVAANTQQ